MDRSINMKLNAKSNGVQVDASHISGSSRSKETNVLSATCSLSKDVSNNHYHYYYYYYPYNIFPASL